MGERYIPPEALGISNKEALAPAKRENGSKSWLRKRAESAFRVLAIGAAFIGAEQAASAREAAGSKEGKDKMTLTDRIEKDTTGGHVRYAQGRQRVDDGELKGDATVTTIKVVDEGDPNVKGDELEVSRSWYRLDADDGTTHWDTRQKVDGQLAGRENPFGHIDGFPKSIREGRMDPSMARTAANMDLQGFSFELRVIRALREIGKADTPEASHALAGLQGEVRSFQTRHPDVPISQSVLDEVFGTQRK